MYKKIAKQVVLITLLIFMILAGVSAPAVSFKSTSIADAALPWTKVSPKKTAEVPVEDAPGMNTNACPTCFTAKGPELNSLWNLLTAGLDIVFSLIPRILVLFIKWIVILLAKLYQGLMAPASSLSFVSKLNNYTKPGSIVLWIWSISLYYANIMITLFLIWIAISIILEKKEYTNYQNLIKLLTVALLVNFSLVICTMFVDLSNFIAVMFMAGLSASDVSCLYACTIHKVANIFDCKSTRILFSTTISNSLAFMVGLVFVGQILGLIFYVLIRMVYLWFLVGVSPIAFVLSAIPETRDIYKKWLGMFIANLTKLPILAFASYFILNLMIYIANDFMLNPIAKDENMLVSTLGVVFLLFILAQGLLAVAQNVGVDQISKASAITNSWAKKSWEAIKKPAAAKATRIMQGTKLYKSGVERLQSSSNATVAGYGNRLANKATIEQAKIAKNMEYLFKGQNVRALEKLADSGDIYIATQAMDYLAQLDKKGDYRVAEGKTKYTENNDKINRIVNAAEGDPAVKDSDAYSSLKSSLTHFKYGAKPLTGDNDIKEAIEEIQAVLNNPDKKGKVNLRSTLEVLMKNSGEKLPTLIEALQKGITPEQLNSVSSSLGSTAYQMFLETITKGIMVGKKAKDNGLTAQQIAAELNNFRIIDPVTNAHMKANIIQYAHEMAGNSEYNWFGKYGKTGKAKNPFDSTVRGRGYLPRIDNQAQTTNYINNNPPSANQQGGNNQTNSNNTTTTATNTAPQPTTDQVMQALRNDIADFSEQLDESHRQMMEEINTLTEQMEANQTEANALSQEAIIARISEFEQRIKALATKLDKIKDTIKGSGKSDVTLMKKAQDLTDQITKLNQEIENLKNKIPNP